MLDRRWQAGVSLELCLNGDHLLISLAVVLVMSIWNDATQDMAWLDAGSNGPCASGAGSPATILVQNPNTHVVFSNIRWGSIGSTTKG